MQTLSTVGVFAGITRSYISNFLRADKATGGGGRGADVAYQVALQVVLLMSGCLVGRSKDVWVSDGDGCLCHRRLVE